MNKDKGAPDESYNNKLQEDIKTEKWHGHLPSSRQQDVCTYSLHCRCNGALRAPNTERILHVRQETPMEGGGGGCNV